MSLAPAPAFALRAVAVAILAAGACSAAPEPAPAAPPPAAKAELLGPEAFARIADPVARSQAMFLEASRVSRPPRCTNCHPSDDSPRQRDGEMHDPPVARGVDDRGVPGLTCTSCHQDHNAQRAWVEMGVPQCGFCQAGQIMTAAALLSKRPKPSDAEIDPSLAGNVCRCGTYTRIRAAVRKAAGITGE